MTRAASANSDARLLEFSPMMLVFHAQGVLLPVILVLSTSFFNFHLVMYRVQHTWIS